MEIQLTKNWAELENLENNKTYEIQGKFLKNKKVYCVDFLLTQSDIEPAETSTEGFVADTFKVKKISGLNIYVKAITLQTTLNVEEVQ